MNNSKLVAQSLLSVGAVKLNVKDHFTFVSGIKSPIYCDNRTVIGFPKQRDIIVDAFSTVLKTKDFDIIAGTSTAGIPWASFIAERYNIPMAYIRSKPKAHGTGNQVEGGSLKNKKVIVIEDLISTGGSCISAVEASRNAGASSVEVVAIFSYDFESTKNNFKKANCNFETLCNFPDLINLAVDENYLSIEDSIEAKQWNLNPKQWKN